MKKNILYIAISLMASCGVTSNPQSPSKESICENKQNRPAIDTLAYRYKIAGNLKSDIGDNEGAIADYTKAIEICPHYDTAYYNRGVIKSTIGDNEGAIADYTRAIEINSKEAFFYYGRGLVKMQMGDKNEAISDYNKAIALKSDYVEAYINRGITKHDNGDTEGEFADYRLAMKNCAPFKDVYNNFGCALCDLLALRRQPRYIPKELPISQKKVNFTIVAVSVLSVWAINVALA